MTSDHDNHENNEVSHHEMMAEDFRTRFIISTILSLPVIILSPLIQEFLGYQIDFVGVEYILLVLSTVIYIYGGWPFFTGMVDEFKDSTPGMMTLVTLAISVSFIYSGAVVLVLESGKFFFWELATLIIVMLLGHWIEMRSVMGASQALKELAKLVPSSAHRITEDGEVEEVKTTELKPGDIVLVKPGEKIPADGEIIEGNTSVNESMVTGESKPVSKFVDDEVIGGTINSDGSIKINIQKTGEDTYLSQVMNLVKEAQETRSKAQNLANRAAFYLTLIAIIGGLITLIVWINISGDFLFALERMVTVMVITCPHALGLAVPLVVSVSTSLSAQNGVLIRDRTRFENARKLDTIVFDKTGTLTKGEFGLETIINMTEKPDNDLLQIAASIESESEHSLARGVVQGATNRDLELKDISGFKAIPGVGVRANVDGNEYRVVSPKYLEEEQLSYDRESVEDLQTKGQTVVFLVHNNTVLAGFGLSDILREESQYTISKLNEMGIDSVMLTGDADRVAKTVADQLGITEYYAEVKPDGKSEIIKQIRSSGKMVAMVGDGINDAPALAHADIGIAIGAGTDVAIESADIILVKDNPGDIIDAINLSKKTYGKMKQNLVWATGYNAVAIPLAAGLLYKYGILLSPAVGAGLMALSTVIVAINARLLDY